MGARVSQFSFSTSYIKLGGVKEGHEWYREMGVLSRLQGCCRKYKVLLVLVVMEASTRSSKAARDGNIQQHSSIRVNKKL